jgi:hypothetical protein
MNCKKIRDLITTDYIDLQLSVKLQRQIREHLKGCGQCREFEQALRQAAVEPFKMAKEIRPPDFVWERIREGIEAEEAETEGLFLGLWDYLRGFLSRRRPVFALSTALAAFIAVAVVINISLGSRKAVNSYFQEQGEFLSGLAVDTGSNPVTNQADLGTSIEEYFL